MVLIFTYAIVWFTAGWAALQVVDTAQAEYNLDDRATGTINLLRDVFAYHPIIVIVAYLLYAFAYSQRRDVRFDTI